MTDDLMTEAVNYTMHPRRWPIFPCAPGGKKPLTEHGLHDASNDPDLAWWWWEEYPAANIGLVTGKGAGVVVLDVDGGDGRASLAALESKHGPLPATMMARSGRTDGGTHFYFLYAGGDIGNSAGRVGKGLDVRGTGGYIILPPSVHETGRRYEWLNDLEPAPLPDWLRLLMLPPAQPAPRRPAAAGDGHGALVRRARIYVAAAESIGEGARNNSAFRLAGHLASFIGEFGDALADAEIYDLLVDYNRRCTPPLGEMELRKAVASAMHNGKARDPKPNRQPAYVRLAMAHAGGEQ